MVLSDQRTPYSIMYVWAAFEAKSPPTRQDVFTLINNYTLYFLCMNSFEHDIRSPFWALLTWTVRSGGDW